MLQIVISKTLLDERVTVPFNTNNRDLYSKAVMVAFNGDLALKSFVTYRRIGNDKSGTGCRTQAMLVIRRIAII